MTRTDRIIRALSSPGRTIKTEDLARQRIDALDSRALRETDPTRQLWLVQQAAKIARAL